MEQMNQTDRPLFSSLTSLQKAFILLRLNDVA